MAKKNTNEVEEYLVKRVKKLESENEHLRRELNVAVLKAGLDKNKLSQFDQVKKLFELSGDGITKAIVVRDFNKSYVGILAIDSNEDFNEYLELLELNGKGEQK